MPRYVILTHDHPFPHWDLLLEAGEVCRTWRLLEEPAPRRIIPAEPLANHRLHYLDYAGPVGGDRGTVARWDWGTYSSDAEETEFGWRITLSGQRGFEAARLMRRSEGEQWWFTPQPSPAAEPPA